MMQRIFSMALLTLREAVRSNLLWTVVGFIVFLIGAITPYAHVTLGEPLFVIKNLGLAGASFGSVLTVILAGSSFLQKELTRKTIFLLLSRPLKRWELIVGKWLGLTLLGSGLLTSMIGIVTIYCTLLEFIASQSEISHILKFFDSRLFWLVPFGILEVSVVSALVVLFSSIFVTPVLAGMVVTAIFLVGRSYSWLESSPMVKDSWISILFFVVIPDLEKLYIANGVIYDYLPDTFFFMQCITYSGFFVATCLAGATLFFSSRDIS